MSVHLQTQMIQIAIQVKSSSEGKVMHHAVWVCKPVCFIHMSGCLTCKFNFGCLKQPPSSGSRC